MPLTNNNNNNNNNNEEKPSSYDNGGYHHQNKDAISECEKPKIGNQRYVLCFAGWLMYVCVMSTFSNLSVAMVGMVNYTAIENRDDIGKNTSSEFTCPVTEEYISEELEEDGEFIWSPATQGLIFSSYFWGNFLFLLPAGVISKRIGGKVTNSVGILFLSMSTMLFPLAARAGLLWLLLCRAFGGVGNAAVQAGSQAVLAKWMPPQERGTMAAIFYSGSPVGFVVALGATGILTDSGFLGGWPSSFYVFGTLGLMIGLFWTIFVYEKPSTHPWISKEERFYIEDSIGEVRHELQTPWWEILTSRAVWALIFVMASFQWNFYLFGALLPTYFKGVLHINLKDNGLISALQYLGRVVVGYFAIKANQWIIDKGYSTTTSRKILTTFSLTGPAIFIGAVTYSGCDRVTNIGMMTMGTSLTGAIFACLFANIVDVSPNFAPIISTMVNIPGSLSGIFAPYAAGLLISDIEDILQWRIVFFITCSFSVFANIVFLLWGTAEVQPWNAPRLKRKSEMIVNDILKHDDNHSMKSEVTKVVDMMNNNVHCQDIASGKRESVLSDQVFLCPQANFLGLPILIPRNKNGRFQSVAHGTDHKITRLPEIFHLQHSSRRRDTAP